MRRRCRRCFGISKVRKPFFFFFNSAQLALCLQPPAKLSPPCWARLAQFSRFFTPLVTFPLIFIFTLYIHRFFSPSLRRHDNTEATGHRRGAFNTVGETAAAASASIYTFFFSFSFLYNWTLSPNTHRHSSSSSSSSSPLLRVIPPSSSLLFSFSFFEEKVLCVCVCVF